MIFLFLIFLFAVSSGQKCPYESGIVRPCPGLDLNCIRSFFARYGYCKPAVSPPLDVYQIKKMVLPVPITNTTVIWDDCSVVGLNNGCITEFYLNKHSGNLVLEVEFDELLTYSSTLTIKYYLKGREPHELKDHASVIYRNMSQTVTVPWDPKTGINWAFRDVYTYFGDPTFPKTYGVLYNSHVDVIATFKKILENLSLTIREAGAVKGPLYFDLYFNNNICEF